MKPSIFTQQPFDSTLQNLEYESIARNIMVILSRTGDTFRKLSWEEYKSERLKDKNFKEHEKPYFEKVLTYCANEERAMCFSPTWRDAYIKELKGMIPEQTQSRTYSREEVINFIGEVLFAIGYDIELDTYPDGTTKGYNIDKWTHKNLK